MAHAENEVSINRPANDVYAFVADGLNNKLWRPTVQSAALASGEPGTKGAVYSQSLSGPGGRPIAGDYEITAAEPNKRLDFQVIAGPARPKGSFTLQESDGTTILRFALDLQPKGFMKLMGSMITKTMQSEVGQLGALKAVLEKDHA
ncbi:SRPBCC family protein [Arthrobacter bambusae]|uniref:SRPBCC family protein n=1 Tax=Arthrobacter bambusae TaxID=1338426 RepID=UPI00278B5A74|nr:SRPBCC family protein [Arthrobacter bambusae]MDQ0032252.1 putative membrane protein [Arthrobacter bambusae]MDQ0100374.1 putative membrane protein [Arthrobacter bambusae]